MALRSTPLFGQGRSQHGTDQLLQRRCVRPDNKLAEMTSKFAGAGPARAQRLLLIPVGQENTHQHTIDGNLPAGVAPCASTSTLLPCWGVTDGNYLVKNKVRAQAGDIFALIRAQHKGQRAYVYRLAVVDTLVRNPSACGELYKISHDYNMGSDSHCCSAAPNHPNSPLSKFMLFRWPQDDQRSFHMDHQVQVSCISQLGQAGK